MRIVPLPALAAVVACGPSPRDEVPGEVPAPAAAAVAQLSTRDRVLWVGAHPDDETTVAPLLAAACTDVGAACGLIVLTRGEAGACKLAGGCPPDLGTWRSGEMTKAATLFGAQLVQGSLADGSASSPEDVLRVWSAQAGSADALVQVMADAFAAFDPSVLLVFDPRHGSTCHPDHRAAARLALAAAQRRGALSATAIILNEVAIVQTPSFIGFAAAVPGDGAVATYDATQRLSTGETGWDRVLADLAVHGSQFTADEVARFAAAPSANRVTPWLRAADAVDGDARYAGLCP